MNPDIAIHVMHFDIDGDIVLLYHSVHFQRKHSVNLLILTEKVRGDANDFVTSKEDGLRIVMKTYYTWIKNMSRLFSCLNEK